MKPRSLICIALVFSTIHSLINCSVYGESCRNYSPLSFRFFSQPFVRFQKKVKMLFTSQGRSVLREIVPSVLRYPRPRAQFFPNTDRPWLVNNIYMDYFFSFLLFSPREKRGKVTNCGNGSWKSLLLHGLKSCALNEKQKQGRLQQAR